MRIVKHFRSEIIKILVFLLLFFASLIYVLIINDDNYNNPQKKVNRSNDSINVIVN